MVDKLRLRQRKRNIDVGVERRGTCVWDKYGKEYDYDAQQRARDID